MTLSLSGLGVPKFSISLRPFVGSDASVEFAASVWLANPLHLRQPSKSIRACIQPHSVTFCSSQTKLTGYTRSQYNGSKKDIAEM